MKTKSQVSGVPVHQDIPECSARQVDDLVSLSKVFLSILSSQI